MIERALHVQKKGEGEEKEGEEGKFSTLKEPAFQIKQIVRHHKRRRGGGDIDAGMGGGFFFFQMPHVKLSFKMRIQRRKSLFKPFRDPTKTE